MKKLFKYLSLAFTIFWISVILSVLILAFAGDNSKEQNVDVSTAEEWSRRDDNSITNHRIWNNFSKKRYELNVDISLENFYASKIAKENIDPNVSRYQYWGNIYKSLVENDDQWLKGIVNQFDSIQNQHNLNQQAFANLLVSFVQDIPYTLLLSKSCDDPSFANLRAEIGYDVPCVGPVKFGLNSPIEFLATLNGDCDTRAVLLFALFKHFGYKTAILVSNHYQHAILGVALPSYGLYKEHLGVKYKVWETTAYGYKIGELSPSVNDLNYWKIALINN